MWTLLNFLELSLSATFGYCRVLIPTMIMSLHYGSLIVLYLVLLFHMALIELRMVLLYTVTLALVVGVKTLRDPKVVESL